MSENYGGYLTGDDEPFEPARINQKTLTVDTGTNLAALSPTYPGQLVFATTTAGGFTADTLYVRNAANSAWLPIATLANSETWTNKSLDGASNTFSAIPTAAIVDGAGTTAKLTALTQIAAVSVGSVQITSTSYVDIASVTITATGSRAALLTSWRGDLNNDTAAAADQTIAITDNGNAVLAERRHRSEAISNYTSSAIIHPESAPSVGSLTRKLRGKTSTGRLQSNGGGQLVLQEVI